MNNDLYGSRPGQFLLPLAKREGRNIPSAWQRFSLTSGYCLAVIITTLTIWNGVAYAAPTPTPTPPTLPATNGPMQLGQPVTNFVKTYGQPEWVDKNNNGNLVNDGFYLFRDDTLLVKTALPSKTPNPKLLITEIHDANTDSKGWANIDEAAKTCQAYAPKDAKSTKPPVQIPAEPFEGEQIPASTVHVYTSPSLASLFQAKDFVDSDKNPVAAGTFSIAYVNLDTTSQRLEGCTMKLGLITKNEIGVISG